MYCPFIKFVVRAPPFSEPNSHDIRRRGVVVRASSDARLRVSSIITTSFTVACSMVANDSMSLPFTDDFDEDDSERESGESVGRIGKQPLRRRTDENPALDVVKMFFDTFGSFGMERRRIRSRRASYSRALQRRRCWTSPASLRRCECSPMALKSRFLSKSSARL